MLETQITHTLKDGTMLSWKYIVLELSCHISPTNPTNQKLHQLHLSLVDLNSSPHSYTIDQETLIDIVKEKNIETLQNHGGVEVVASNLRINIEFWLF